MTDARYPAENLIATTRELFAAAGLDGGIAQVVAEILVEADLLGYSTHGLQFVPAYMKMLESGKWTTAGTPSLAADNGAALVIDGQWLPGQYVVVSALETALGRIAGHPVVTVAIKHCHNISCLATYAKRGAEAGYLTIVAASAPGNAVVAPAGGREGRLSTSPFAAGIPARSESHGHPILFDTATSAVTNRAIERARREGTRLPYMSLVDADGQATDDPEAIYTDPPGAILPMGGMETGHKGYLLSLLIEALTSALAGYGRAPGEKPASGNTVFLQLIDPAGFGGAEAFAHETGYLADSLRATPPMDAARPVRAPGDRAYALWHEQTANGVQLHPEILPRMAPLLEKYGISMPAAL